MPEKAMGSIALEIKIHTSSFPQAAYMLFSAPGVAQVGQSSVIFDSGCYSLWELRCASKQHHFV